MLTIKTITEQRDEVIRRLAVKHFDATEIIDRIIALDKTRRASQTALDANLTEVNRLSKQIGGLMKEGKRAEADEAKAEVSRLKETNRTLEADKTQAEKDMHELLVLIPNLPHASVPEGTGADDNRCEETGGTIPELPADALPHWELARKYDIIDFELGVKITGAGFPVYKGKGARLQRALVNFFLDCARDAGYVEIEPPYVVNAESGYGTGQLPDKEGQMYHANLDDLYLIPTAEVQLTNIHRDEVLDASQLPLLYTAFTPCFREEAGSAGRDTRGIIRVHEFDKVEMVKFAKPEDSMNQLESMVAEAELCLQTLGLPYHVVTLCTGDIGFSARKCYDIEVWLPSYDNYKEISSCSNCWDFQARRANIRYRDPSEFKGTRYVHTLNGSGLAVGRTMAAIMENYQNADGSITIPEALVPYMGGVEVIKPEA